MGLLVLRGLWGALGVVAQRVLGADLLETSGLGVCGDWKEGEREKIRARAFTLPRGVCCWYRVLLLTCIESGSSILFLSNLFLFRYSALESFRVGLAS